MATKTDNERLGYFSEPSYLSIGDKYKSRPTDRPLPFNRGANKKAPMMTTSTKTKSGLQSGYMSKQYDRIFSGEATYDPVRARRKAQAKSKAKNVAGAFKPAPAPRKLSSIGSHDGTFSGKVESFSPKSKAKAAYKSEPINFLTRPGKKGSGYGYLDVGLGKLPEYKSSPYKNDEKLQKKAAKAAQAKLVAGPFKLNDKPSGGVFTKNPYEPRKPPAGKRPKDYSVSKKVPTPFYPSKPLPSMAGSNKNLATFTKFSYADGGKPKKGGKAAPPKFGTFKPQPGSKSTVTKSVVSMVATRSVNSTNFKSPRK